MAFSFQVFDADASASSIAPIYHTTKKSIEDFGYLLARWERQFWIQLPSDDKIPSVYPDEADQEWIMMYRSTRQRRSNSLNTLRKEIDETLKTLTKTKKIPPSAAYDPGLMKIPEHIVQWMPTAMRLMRDMAVRAAQNLTRYWSIFNPATHVFYRENLQKEARAEWEFYQKQLQAQFDEPATPTVMFPAQHKYQQFEKKQFKFCRYAYFDNGRFLDAPLDSAGNTLQVAKWTPANLQWIKQPVADHPINIYDRDNPDSNVWPPAPAADASSAESPEI